MRWKRLRKKVLDEFAPNDEEIQDLNSLYSELSEFIESRFGYETHFAGSASRQTCMAGDSDLDLFVLFPSDKSRDELEEEGLEIGKEVFEQFGGDFEVEYAEHPYTKGDIDGTEVEIVPCFDVPPEEIRSSVDRTPHHSRWVQESLDEEQRQDVVALKAFLTAAGIYGSSLKTKGFSGYLCEILIAEYGSFDRLIQEAPDWSENQVIDPESHHEEGFPGPLEEKFEEDDLVVIDPVDPERNVAAVMSDQSYAEFVYRCWEFRESPGMRFFREQGVDVTEFEIGREIEDRADFLVLCFDRPEGVDDIVYPQMEKTLRALERVLEREEFRIYESGFHVGEEVRVFFELDSQLPEVRYVEGPKVFHNEEHLDQFRSKYDNVFVEGSRIVAKTEREYMGARELLSDVLENPKNAGIPDRVADELDSMRYVEPLEGGDEWLKYLAEKLHM